MEKKKCSLCRSEKDFSLFSNDKHSKDGKTSSCKECRRKKDKEYREKNKDKVRDRNKKNWRKRKEFYSSERGIESSRRSHLKRKYDMTLEEYNHILEKQENTCAICGNHETTKRNRFLTVDHCHETNKIRGLLCNNCNRTLGLLGENIETLKKMIEYLIKHKT